MITMLFLRYVVLKHVLKYSPAFIQYISFHQPGIVYIVLSWTSHPQISTRYNCYQSLDLVQERFVSLYMTDLNPFCTLIKSFKFSYMGTILCQCILQRNNDLCHCVPLIWSCSPFAFSQNSSILITHKMGGSVMIIKYHPSFI